MKLPPQKILASACYPEELAYVSSIVGDEEKAQLWRTLTPERREEVGAIAKYKTPPTDFFLLEGVRYLPNWNLQTKQGYCLCFAPELGEYHLISYEQLAAAQLLITAF